MLKLWPAQPDCPSAATLRNWLARAASRGLLLVEGSGRRSDPLRSWLPEREAIWRQDPIYELFHGAPRPA